MFITIKPLPERLYCNVKLRNTYLRNCNMNRSDRRTISIGTLLIIALVIGIVIKRVHIGLLIGIGLGLYCK